jgi:hypothetical protein
MFIIAAMAVMLIGSTAFATDSAFADGKKHYEKNKQSAKPMHVEMVNYH